MCVERERERERVCNKDYNYAPIPPPKKRTEMSFFDTVSLRLDIIMEVMVVIPLVVFGWKGALAGGREN